MPKRKLKGIIISDKMQKTVVVRVESLKTHPKYKKRFKSHKNYKAHLLKKEITEQENFSEKNQYQVGDKVVIEECRPISKEKKWRVIAKI